MTLTLDKQLDILQSLDDGMTYKQIVKKFGVSTQTIGVYKRKRENGTLGIKGFQEMAQFFDIIPSECTKCGSETLFYNELDNSYSCFQCGKRHYVGG